MKDSNSLEAGLRPSDAGSWKNEFLRLGRWIIFLSVSSGIAHRIWIEKEKITSYPFSLHSGWVLLSTACYLAGMAGCAIFWWLTLHDVGEFPSFLRTLYAYFVGHLGKYVPGKGLVIVIRAGLLRQVGVSISDAAFASVVETLFLMCVGGLVCVFVFSWAPFPHRYFLLFSSLAISIGFGSLIVPPVALIVRNHIARYIPAVKNGGSCRWQTLGKGLPVMFLTWAVCGLSLLLVFKAMNHYELLCARMGFFKLWAVATASVAFATVAGFVSMIPGGLGTREWVLIETLGPIVGSTQVMLAAGIIRLQWIVAELLAAATLWCFTRQWKSPEKHPN